MFVVAFGVVALGTYLMTEQQNRWARNNAERQGDQARAQVENEANEAELAAQAEVHRQRLLAEEGISRERIQVNLQEQITNACREGNLEQVPGWLRTLDDSHFLNLGTRPLAEALNEDTLLELQQMLIAEEERRFPNTNNTTV